jgi:hypothetical protein
MKRVVIVYRLARNHVAPYILGFFVSCEVPDRLRLSFLQIGSRTFFVLFVIIIVLPDYLYFDFYIDRYLL